MTYDKYIGLPYLANGRTEEGLDCWGLVCLFYKNELNIELPSYVDSYDGPNDVAITFLMAEYKDANWIKKDTPEVGDVCVFNILGEPTHVGVYIGNNKFIHSREGSDVAIESLDNHKWNKRLEGIYSYSSQEQVIVVGAPHPLKTTVYKEWTVAGTTVSDFVKFTKEKYNVSDKLSSRLKVVVDGIPIPQENWDTTVLQAGQTIAYRSVAEGGGNPLRTILTIAVIIVAAQYAPQLGGWMEGIEAGAAVSPGYQAAAQAAMTMAGLALVNAIAPIRLPTLNQNDPGTANALSLFSGGSNQANKFGAIPVVLGKVRITGMLGAVPYIESQPNTSLLNLLVIWGFGPLQVDDICIGTNSISAYYDNTLAQDIPKYQTLKGTFGEDTKEFNKIYPQSVEQKVKQLELVNNSADGNPWQTVLLNDNADSVAVSLSFPEGMRSIITKGNSAGDVDVAQCGIEIQIGTHDPLNPGAGVTWIETSPYSVGNWSSATPDAEAFIKTVDANSNNEEYGPLYRQIIIAMPPSGGIELFEGTASDRVNQDPSASLIAAYRKGSYSSLVGINTDYSFAPKIPASYIKLYTLVLYQGSVYSTVSNLSSYSGEYTGLVLKTDQVLDSDGYANGSITVTVSAGRISSGASSDADPGVEQTIFTSRDFTGIVNLGPDPVYSTILNTYGVWSNTQTETVDLVKNVTFPYSGYYNFEASANDYGKLIVAGVTILDIPGWTEVASGLTYIEAGVHQVRLLCTNLGGGKSVACKISYTANAGLNTVAATGTTLYFGTAGFFSKRKDAFNFTYRVAGLPKTYHAVRVRRTTTDQAEIPGIDKHFYYKAILYSVTGYAGNDINGVPQPPAKNPPGCLLAQTAIRVQSTNKVNGNIEGLNALLQTMAPTWDGTTWNFARPLPTNNPASLFIYVLTHPANAYRVELSDIANSINLAALGDWYTFCNGDNIKGIKFSYNDVVTGNKSVMDVLRDICAAGMASPAFVDGKWTVIIDRPRTYTTQYFTTHNSWGFESTKVLPKLPDAFRISFPNEALAYQMDEIFVYNYGKNKDNARIFESLSLPGVTNATQATFFAKWHLAQLKLRPEVYTLNTDFEYLVCTRGDLVKVTHDVTRWGTGSGRIKSINGAVLQLTEEIPLTAGISYNILVRKNNGQSETKTLAPITTSGYYDTITLATALDNSSGIAVDNLFMIGELNTESQQLIVVGIEPSANTSAKLTLVDYSPAIYTADATDALLVYNANISGDNSNVSQSTINAAPIIAKVTSNSALSQQISTGTYQNILMIGYTHPAGLSQLATKIETQILESDSEFVTNSPTGVFVIDKELSSLAIPGLKTNGMYKIRARYTNSLGSVVGPWCATYYANNNGKNTNTYTAPTISLDLEGTYIVASTTTDLNKPADFKTYEYRLYKDAGTEDFWELDPTTNGILVVQSTGQGRFNLLNVPTPRISAAGITYRVACRAVNSTNNYSTESALGTIVVSTIK